MKKCPKCGNTYLDPFVFCPVDAQPLQTVEGGAERAGPQPRAERATITIRTLMVSIAALVLVALMSFSAVFFYQYWKPKYGSLVIKTTPSGAIVSIDGK